MIYEPLAMTNQIRPTDKADPWLATDWTWESNFTKVTFTLDDRAKWADGKPLTADDVAYTFELLKKHPALNGNGIPFDGVAVRGREGRPDLQGLAVRQPEQDHPDRTSCPSTSGRRSRTRRPGPTARRSAPARTS